MKTYTNGLLAGLVATLVLSVLMIIKAKMGMMPDVNVIAMLASKMGGKPVMGWLAHFMIGVVGYGLIYPALFNKLSLGSTMFRGAAMGFTGWVVMMVVAMPMMGVGMFGLKLASGIMVPIITLVLHLIFGVVLSTVYRKL